MVTVPFSSRHERDQIFLKESFTQARKMTGMTAGSTVAIVSESLLCEVEAEPHSGWVLDTYSCGCLTVAKQKPTCLFEQAGLGERIYIRLCPF